MTDPSFRGRLDAPGTDSHPASRGERGAAPGGIGSGYQVDPDALSAFATRLEDAADEVAAAASALEEPVGDLGPAGVTAAVEALLDEWARALHGLELPVVADGVRAAGEAYRRADELDHD